MKTQKELEAQLEAAVIDCFMIPNEMLPESYRSPKRSHRKLSSVVSDAKRRHRNMFKDGREVSVKFDTEQNVTSARPERLAALERYAACVENEEEIDYDVNDDKLYGNQVTFLNAMATAGVISLEDFDD